MRLLSRKRSSRPRRSTRSTRPKKLLSARPLVFETLEPRLLLAGDLSLVAPLGQALDLTARLNLATQAIELIDNQTGTVAASQAVADFGPADRIVITGNDRDDRLIVQYGAEGPFAIPIDFDGGTQATDGDVLQVIGTDTLWHLTGQGQGTVGLVQFTGAENLRGGAGADTFQFGTGASLTGALDGSGGADTLDAAASTTAREFTLTGLGTVDGFRGTEAAIGGGFSNIEALVGGTASDTLRGLQAGGLWEIGANRYVSTNTLSFTSVENLTGGNASDAFRVSAIPSGVLTGGDGSDALDFSTFDGPVNLLLQGADATGFRGDGTLAFVGIDTLTGSRSTRDSLTDQTGSPTTTWDLDADPTFSDGTHTLHFSHIEGPIGAQDVQVAFGPTADTTARDLTLRYDPVTQEVQLVDGVTLVPVSTAVVTPAADNLVQVAGTAGADALRIDASVAAAGLAVAFDARGGGDTLDLRAYPGPGTTVLEKTDAEGFSGVGPVAFRGVDALLGASAPGDTLRDETGAAAATWQLDTLLTYIAAGPTLTFSGFEQLEGGLGSDTFTISGVQTIDLAGGAGADVFLLNSDATLTGTLAGGAGADVFGLADGAAVTGALNGGADMDALAYGGATAHLVQLTGVGSIDGFAGTATGVTGGFSNIDIVQGGAGQDTLTGRDAAATWTLAATTTYGSDTRTLDVRGLETLVGGNAADTFDLSGPQTAEL